MLVASKMLIKCEYCLFFIVILGFTSHFMLTISVLFHVFCGEILPLFLEGTLIY